MAAVFAGEVDRLLQRGALPGEIHNALLGFGLPKGLLMIEDLLPVDVLADIKADRRSRAAQTIASGEIIERVLFPLINEGAHILAEVGTLLPSDIDLLWQYGHAWPRQMGGPMLYVDKVGAAHIVGQLNLFSAECPDALSLRPAALLVELAEGDAASPIGRTAGRTEVRSRPSIDHPSEPIGK
ncbi:hypothetical protein [Sphingobium sp. LB126]|uniref:hypothetical protein n=1 Tax=Sphingobium sp. LB126 TaxID=1983755 RepID=UPI0012FD62B4|nr:hypothetical protein [Sphingobium sp. LB126]